MDRGLELSMVAIMMLMRIIAAIAFSLFILC
jgi:hypothetical protein